MILHSSIESDATYSTTVSCSTSPRGYALATSLLRLCTAFAGLTHVAATDYNCSNSTSSIVALLRLSHAPD
jgi:hypothetical protein